MSIDYNSLVTAAKLGQNVLLIGTHGTGKTTVTRNIFNIDVPMKLKYYSAATLDPWADLVGIPVPVEVENGKKHKELQFIRPKDVDQAEVIFFDELNRAHPKVLNAVMEICQFKSINGEPLPKLKMVWAAINPPNGQYQVSDLDPALADRFHIHMEFLAEPSHAYLSQACGSREVATQVLQWWSALTEQQKILITPRRLEYLCRNAKSGLALKLFIPFGTKVPTQALEQMLNGKKQINSDNLKDSKFRAEVVQRLKANEPEAMTAVVKALSDMKSTSMFIPSTLELLEVMSKEARTRLFTSSTSKTGANLTRYVEQYYNPTERARAGFIRPEIQRFLKLWDEHAAAIRKR